MNEPIQEQQSGLKLSIILSLIIVFIALNIMSSSSGSDFKINMDDTGLVLGLKILQGVSVIFLFILPAILFSVFWTKAKIHYLGISKKPKLFTLIIASIGMFAALPVINYMAQWNEQMHLPEIFGGIEAWMRTSENNAKELTEAFTKGTSISVLIVNIIVIALMAALSEEIFFRGVVQKVLLEVIKNKHIAVWIGAALFSAFHMQFFGFFPRMVMGAFLGYLFLWSGSLWPSILAHFVNNGAAVLLMWLANRGAISAEVDKIGSESNELVIVFISCVLVAGSLILIYKLEKKKADTDIVSAP